MGPLAGIRVLELGSLIAGPFCAKTLGDFGAEVIKIEPPGEGDALRRWRRMRKGTSLWWQVQSRNKKSVTCDLRRPEGQEIVRRLARRSHIVIENFRPGALEKWNLGWQELSRDNPKLILVRISGYGQTGPYRERPGFAAIAEAVGGMRYITGFPDRPPVRPNLSLGDTIAALHGVIGALLALHHIKNGGQGQVIDVALYEAVFNCMESLLPEFDADGTIRERSGSTLPGIAPSNLYPCRDGSFVLIAGNADSLYQRLMSAIGRADLRDDPALARNDGRAAQMARIDAAISQWTASRTLAEVLEAMAAAQVPAGRIYTVADIAADPHYAARRMIETITANDGESLKVPGVVPKLSETPGAIRSQAPKLGEHTDEVLREIGYHETDITKLRQAKIL
jgi:formyl-CoA transferase